MTETVMPKELTEALKPDYVATLVAVLAHDKCPENGQLYELGAGYVAKLRWQRSEGKMFQLDKYTPEAVLDSWKEITQYDKGFSFPTGNEEMI